MFRKRSFTIWAEYLFSGLQSLWKQIGQSQTSLVLGLLKRDHIDLILKRNFSYIFHNPGSSHKWQLFPCGKMFWRKCRDNYLNSKSSVETVQNEVNFIYSMIFYLPVPPGCFNKSNFKVSGLWWSKWLFTSIYHKAFLWKYGWCIIWSAVLRTPATATCCNYRVHHMINRISDTLNS